MNDRTDDRADQDRADQDRTTRSRGRDSAANQQTMAIPVVTDRPSPAAGRPAMRTDTGTEPATPGQRPAPARPQPESRIVSDGASPVSTSARVPAKTRKARLRVVRLDPWSVMKVAFALSIALAIVTVVSVAIVWSVLGAAGVWDAINSSVGTVLDENDSSFDITDFVGMSRVLGLTAIVSAANVVLLTAIATLAAFLYNLTATLLGGLEVTLAEDR